MDGTERTRGHGLHGEREFRWRGGEVSRIEALSDAAFAFALTLLALSSEVPRTFDELRRLFVELPVFLACSAVLVMIWYFHYRYHRRFGFEDFPSVLFNATLLVLVLFYVYPLKFMMTFLWSLIRGTDGRTVLDDGTVVHMLARSDGQALMWMYGGGYAAIFVLFLLMYAHAWRHRERLDLDARERWQCGAEMLNHGYSAAVGLLACGLAALGPRWAAAAGFSFFLLPVGHAAIGILGAVRFTRRFGG